MTDRSSARGWMRHLVRREERTTTTWPLRLGLLACAVLALWLTRGFWSVAVARGLRCDEDLTPSAALLVENLDQDFSLFERAAALRKAGVAERVLVPTPIDRETAEPDVVEVGIVNVMAEIALLDPVEVVPVPVVEPISLNAAYLIREFLEREHIGSVTVVTPIYRSRRSALVYSETLGPSGILVRCAPVQGPRDPGAWSRTWHGIQEVTEQWLKLQYYRFYVLPLVHRGSGK